MLSALLLILAFSEYTAATIDLSGVETLEGCETDRNTMFECFREYGDLDGNDKLDECELDVLTNLLPWYERAVLLVHPIHSIMLDCGDGQGFISEESFDATIGKCLFECGPLTRAHKDICVYAKENDYKKPSECDYNK